VTDAERRLLDAIDMTVPWELVETFAQHPRVHPRDVNVAAEMIAERLRAHGIPVLMHEASIFLTIPHHAEVRAGDVTFGGKAPAGCADAQGGVTAPLVYVPAGFAIGSEDVFDTFDAKAAARTNVAGKIAITEGFASPATVTNLARLGAVAVIAINPGADSHWGTCTSVWGTPGHDERNGAPNVPAINVNRPDGDALKAMAERSESVTVAVTMESGWFKSIVPEVRIEGKDSDDFVLVHGHYDSWDVGVGDNATGDATLLELARLLHARKDELTRGVRIAWWPGHSTGRYAGSTWYADTFAVDLVEHCVAQVNCDSPGCRWATEYKDVSLTAETERFAASIIQDAVGQPLFAERAHQAGDYSFNNLGLSGYFMLLSTMPDDVREEKGYYGVGGCGGNIAWHTEHDTLEVADREILEKDVRIYALAAYRNATARYLPLDFRDAVQGHLATLDRYQQAARSHFDLTPAKEAAQGLKESLDQLAVKLEAGTVDQDVANALLKKLSRELVPLDYTTRPRFDHDPALTIPPLPDVADAEKLADMDEHERAFAVTSLVRGRNRIVATLRSARTAVADVLS